MFLVCRHSKKTFWLWNSRRKKQLTAEFSGLKFSVGSPTFYPFSDLILKYGPKGQLFSKCPFGVFVWSKIPTKEFYKFLPKNLKRGQIIIIIKIKALHNVFDTLESPYMYIIICKLQYCVERSVFILLISPLFRFSGRNLSNIFVGNLVLPTTPKGHFEIN